MIPSDVSVLKRIFQICASILFCFTVAGLVFGFAALKPILIDSGVYNHLCAPEETYCKAQDTRLNALFVVATSANNVAALPIGTFLDKVGPRTASITGGVIFALGCIVFSLGIVKPWLDTYLIGYAMLALGAPAMFLAQFHLSNAFPARSGLVLSSITGAFDASSLPLCVYKVIYFAYGHKPTARTFFMFYTIIPALLVIQQITFGPPSTYSRPLSEDTISVTNHIEAPSPRLHADRGEDGDGLQAGDYYSSAFSRVSYNIHDGADEEEVKLALEGHKNDGIVGAMFGRGVKEQITSSWFWAMEFVILVHMTRINWYLATVNTQLIYYTGDIGLADFLTDAFIFLLPIGGLLSIPAVGYLLDSRPTLDVIFVMSFLGLIFGIGTLLPSSTPQLIGIAMLVIFRPLFYTAVSDYAAKVFGFQTFGTVYGLAMTMSGLFGLVLTPLDIFVKGPFEGDYTIVNVVLAVLGVISTFTLAYKVWSSGKKGRIALEVIEEENEDVGA